MTVMFLQPLYKGQFQKLLLNLCAHHETRTSLMQILMDMLMLDVRGPIKNLNGAEPSYRLYSCQSHVMYSRPQFADGKCIAFPCSSWLKFKEEYLS